MRWAALALVVVACADDKAPPPKQTGPKPVEEERTNEFVRARKALATSLAHVNLGALPTATKPCPDDMFADFPFDDRKLYVLDEVHVAELKGAPPPSPKPFIEDDARFLSDGMTDEIHAAGGMTHEVDAMARARVFGVVRRENVTLPSLAEGKLVPGVAKGWLVVVEQASGFPLCHAPYEARSSASISVKRLPNKRDMTPEAQAKLEEQTAAMMDFKERHRAAYRAALTAISSRLVLAH